MEPSERPKSLPISDGAFYFIAGFCGLAGGIVGAAFHLTVDALLRWPAWLVARFGDGPETIVMAAAIAA